MSAAPEVFVALDYSSGTEALALVNTLGEHASFYKVGLQLFTAAGSDVLEALRERGKHVFLDLKYHDIPNTVAAAVEAAATAGVEMATVHIAGGRAMLEAARNASGGRVRLLGVTLLTSLAAPDLEEVWGRPVAQPSVEVERLGHIAADAGLDGAVASVFEAAELKRAHGRDFLVVTPGIRFAGDDPHDQRRVATPAAAARAGADAIVVGRPITRALDPVVALRRVVAEFRAAEVEQ